MEKINLKEKVSDYDSHKINKFFDKFKENLNTNKQYIEKANDIDLEITKKKIKLEILFKIIDKYKQVKFENLDKTYVIYYKSDPYLTINLFMQALLTRSKIVLAQDEFMISINHILYTIFNQTLKEFQIYNLVNSCPYDKKKIIETKELLNAQLISIGDTLMYQILDEKGKFYPYYNIMMYCDDNELDSLKEAISIYSNENHYELEIVYEEDINIAINYINMVDTSNVVVLLSKNENNIKLFKQKINKKLIINENPFLEKYAKIYYYLK